MIATGNETGRRSHAAALGAAGWLGLAAAPTFAAMALLTYVPGGGADMMCSAAHGVSSMSGMVPMYVLMSAFHSGALAETDLPPTKCCPRINANGFAPLALNVFSCRMSGCCEAVRSRRRLLPRSASTSNGC